MGHGVNVKEIMETETAGIKPMQIEGRMREERERAIGMTPEERAWRAQWIKDQELDEGEPLMTESYYKQRYNPLRRFYMAPMNLVQDKFLAPIMGRSTAAIVRTTICRGTLGLLGIYYIFYYIKYNSSDWSRTTGWKVIKQDSAQFLSDPGFPTVIQRKDSDYASFGFDKSPI